MIKLNQNELPYALPKALQARLVARLSRLSLNRYPVMEPLKLKQALAKKLKLKSDQVLVGTGSNILLQALVLSLKEKTPVMSAQPSFALYDLIPKTFAYPFVAAPLSKKDFSLDEKKFFKILKEKKPGLIFLANPNAPTGRLYEPDFIKQVLVKAPALVLLDEAYYEFSGVTWVKELKKYPNLLISRTFSKAYGLGGVRLGYVLGQAKLLQEIKKAYVPFNVGIFNEEAALFALEQEAFFKEKVQAVLKERSRLGRAMVAMEDLEAFPSEANFLLFRVKKPQACFDFLKKSGVLVRNVSGQKGLSGCLRVTVGTPRENGFFLQALKRFL